MTTRAKLVEIFEDTLDMIRENPSLIDTLRESSCNTKLYRQEDDIKVPDLGSAADKNCRITVSSDRTFEAAQKLSKKYNMRIGVLNFASATSPGGGVTHGAFAQEECLCRCSTLYPVLNEEALWKSYYEFHRNRKDSLYTDACIYTPGVKVIKSDIEEPKRLQPHEWFDVDVITCAAPNLYFDAENISDEELLKIHLNRGEKILKVAIENNVTVLVLGAFGCGAFRNNPAIVAEAYRQLLDKYKNHFFAVEFAVYCRDEEKLNYQTFKKALV